MITVYLKRRVSSSDPKKSWFKTEDIRVTLNPWSAAMQVVDK
jgi:hypothetical protein